MAWSFLTFSHLGMRATIVSNMVRTQVASKAATITTLPWFAANSLNMATFNRKLWLILSYIFKELSFIDANNVVESPLFSNIWKFCCSHSFRLVPIIIHSEKKFVTCRGLKLSQRSSGSPRQISHGECCALRSRSVLVSLTVRCSSLRTLARKLIRYGLWA